MQTGEVVAKMASYCPDITIKYALRGEESKFRFINIIPYIAHLLENIFTLGR